VQFEDNYWTVQISREYINVFFYSVDGCTNVAFNGLFILINVENFNHVDMTFKLRYQFSTFSALPGFEIPIILA
jgi:hypothetical protein